MAHRAPSPDQRGGLQSAGQGFRQGHGMLGIAAADGQGAGGADRQAVLTADAVMHPGGIERWNLAGKFDDVKGAIGDAGPALDAEVAVNGELQVHAGLLGCGEVGIAVRLWGDWTNLPMMTGIGSRGGRCSVVRRPGGGPDPTGRELFRLQQLARQGRRLADLCVDVGV